MLRPSDVPETGRTAAKDSAESRPHPQDPFPVPPSAGYHAIASGTRHRSAADIRGQRRSKNLAKARQVSMYLMRNLTNLSLVDIGSQYEGRNHSTVLTSIRKVEDLIKTDPEISATVRDISSNINSRS